MKSKKIIKIISIIISLLLIIFLIYKIITKEEKYFKKIKFDEKHYITNITKFNYLDTIIHAGLQTLKIDTVYVIIKPMIKLQKDNFTDDNFIIEAFIIGNDKQYIIYIEESSKENHLKILSHELIHLKQYYFKELTTTDNEYIIIWKGDSINLIEEKYENRLWEIEAFENQNKITENIKKILYE